MENTKVDSIVSLAADLAGKADDCDEVLVLYRTKSGAGKSMDNNLDVGTALLLVEQFKLYLLTCMAQETS